MSTVSSPGSRPSGVCAVAVASMLCAAAPSRAQTNVASCAQLDPVVGVQITDGTTLTIRLDREPGTASGADVRLTAFDPDDGNEVSATLNGVALPDFDTLGSWNARKFSYSVPIDPTGYGLQQGTNTLVFQDNNGASPFALHRLCIGLVGAAAPSPQPSSELLCAQGIHALSFTQSEAAANFDVETVARNATIVVDRPIGPAVGLQYVVYDGYESAGTKTVTLTRNATSLAGSFVGATGGDNYVVHVAPLPSLLVTALTANTIAVHADFYARIWDLCLDVGPVAAAPVDAGFVLDAGTPGPDSGADLDGGVVVADAGQVAPAGDAGSAEDAGTAEAAPDGGGATDGGHPAAIDVDDAGAVIDSEAAAAALSSMELQVTSGCGATSTSQRPALAVLVVLALLRRPRASPPLAVRGARCRARVWRR